MGIIAAAKAMDKNSGCQCIVNLQLIGTIDIRYPSTFMMW